MKNPPDFPGSEPAFIAELRNEPLRHVRWNQKENIPSDELDLRGGILLNTSFSDPEGLLDSVFSDFQRFLVNNAISGSKVILALTHAEDLHGENYALTISQQGIFLEAGSGEGIRRAVYRIMGMLREQSRPALPFQARKITVYWLKERISRCFFSPIKRPPFSRDELLDEIDYYPDNYLSRLAEAGINGLWITIILNEMRDTKKGCRRFVKLNQVIQRCRRYGIKIWAFCIEPQSWSNANLPPKHAPELVGPMVYGRWNCFCPASELASRMLFDSVYGLFQKAPGLAGMITISHGERITSCLSSLSLYSDGKIPCDRQCDLKPAEIINKVLTPMLRGMQKAAPDAKLISWLYMPHADQTSEWIYQLPQGIPPEVVMMVNFESGCRSRQLGKLRNGGDYWLSCSGPAERFSLLAQHRRPHPIAAKIQVGCSHECATVPFIPVPGQLYRKYRSMKELGVQYVMQCWYFGNYPGVMNDAAGLLATDAVDCNEEAFLNRLAKPDWGENSSRIARIWNRFAAAYEYYPLDIQFQYYGPMHDGPVWPLYPEISKKRLPQSWKPYREAAGDAIGECLLGHSLDECVALTGKMSEIWHETVENLAEIVTSCCANDLDRQRDLSLAKALDIQFNSAFNILRFYALRKQYQDTHQEMYSKQLQKIIQQEITNSQQLTQLCQQDPRLGYHSEAEVFKYFPEKLTWRIKQLQKLLSKSIPPASEAKPERRLGCKYQSGGMTWEAHMQEDQLIFNVLCRNPEKPNEVLRFFFADKDFLTTPWSDLVVRRDRTPPDDCIERQTVSRPQQGAVRDILQIAKVTQSSHETSWQTTLIIPHAALNHALDFRFGIQHDCSKLWGTADPENILDNDPPGVYPQEDRLYLGFFTPEKLSLFTLRKNC